MALRHGRGAGLRRVASRRAGFVALAAALYLASGIAATWPAVLHSRSHFMSGGAPGNGEASPGDHLQTLYHYWLVGHQLEHGRAPWRDPYTFRPEAKAQPNYAGWPFGFLFWPLGAIPFVLAYMLVRRRDRRAVIGAVAGALAAVGAGLLVRETLIRGSTEAGGRKLAEITRYSAHVGDLFSRHLDHGRSEQFTFLGWLAPLLALAGLILLVRARRYALGALLAVGVVVPVVLALGTDTPIYSPLGHTLPPFRFPRVPERLLPIACLCLAALVAFALARARTAAVVIVIGLLFVDLHV